MTASTSESERPAANPHPVTDIVDRLAETAENEQVTIGEVCTAFGRRSYLPLLVAPALAVMSPLSGIPLFSSFCGVIIALVAAQMVIPGLESLWIPGIIARRRISGRRLRKAIGSLAKIAHWLDERARQRLKWLIVPPGRTVLETICLICGAAMPFLEFIPFSSSVAGGAVLLIATGLLTRDGLFALAGLAVLVVFGTLLGVGLETLGLTGG